MTLLHHQMLLGGSVSLGMVTQSEGHAYTSMKTAQKDMDIISRMCCRCILALDSGGSGVQGFVGAMHCMGLTHTSRLFGGHAWRGTHSRIILDELQGEAKYKPVNFFTGQCACPSTTSRSKG